MESLNTLIPLILKTYVIIFLVVITPKVKVLINKFLARNENDKLRSLVKTFVEAAEQMLKEQDPTGEKRKQYVVEQLQLLNVEITNYINALIEQEVLNIK